MKSNGLGTAPRRRGRGRVAVEDAVVAAGAGADGVARLDALALALAQVSERSAIIERTVREVMALVPAESVIVRADAPPEAHAATDEDPARATIPLEVGGLRFGAFELRLKSERTPDAAERTFLQAIARQCALALARLPAAESGAMPVAPAQPQTIDAEAVTAALDRVTAGVRALVSVARSAALPSPRRIAEAERIAISNLDDLRRQVGC